MVGPSVHICANDKGQGRARAGGTVWGARKGIPPRAQTGAGVNTCSPDPAKVSTLGLHVFTFSPNVSSFSPNVSSFSRDVSTLDPVRPPRQGGSRSRTGKAANSE